MAKSTEEILNHHLQSFAAGNLNGILEDFTDTSVIITPTGAVLRGPQQMKPFFEALFNEFAKPGASFNLIQRVVDAEVAYISWSAETADNVYELGTDTFFVRNGKIIAQTLAVKATAKR
jgi:ketosteroid isomerase-like protein